MKRLALGIFVFLALSVCTQFAFSAVIFQSDVESATTCGGVFNDVNCYDGGACAISSTYSNSGSKSIRLTYPADEAGCELKPPVFAATKSLYTRKYEYYPSNWAGNWPVGLKTSRYFTTDTFSTGEEPNAYAYMSEKLIWQGYDGNSNDQYGRGMCNAIYNKDLESWYQTTQVFKNGLPFIRTNHWYKYETWMVLNSAVNVADGVLKVWIDDVLVYENNTVMYKSTSRGVPNGTAWKSMWFGGNYSGAVFGNPSATLYRYIDDVYLSTTLDRGVPVPAGFHIVP